MVPALCTVQVRALLVVPVVLVLLVVVPVIRALMLCDCARTL